MAGVKRSKCDREELKKRVIEEASRAFGKYGIRNVHMDNLACALSISKRTLYELFCDKEQLLLEVLIMHQQKMGTYISEVASRAQNALEVIFAFYKRKLNELTELNPLFLRDLRKYPNVLSCIRERQKQSDAAALIHFQKGVNVLIGENDSGKTAIVDAIRYVLRTQSGEFIQFEDKDFYQDSDGNRKDEFKINVKEKGKVNDNTAKMQSTNQLGV